MPNNYFQFKQFTIYQDRCALKVNTDSCVFGAWLARKTASLPYHIEHCLDIGAGSGLLMLMLAQQFRGSIHGVEIDRDSCEQATENIHASPWRNRLTVSNDDAKLFSVPHRYDFIISNPPFFEADLKSPNHKYNFAKHSDGLTLKDLLIITTRNLSEQGSFAVLLPFHRTIYFEQLAASYGLYVSEKLLMRQSPQHPYFRSALYLTRKECDARNIELVIRKDAQSYSQDFIDLLKNYYLHL